ncbi:hypothetical protein RF11_05876 [Thelohanellus kitauei]|uniref:Winged helix-turn helix domain-containing protein n=1 Tax=Thelohanellus kitauei TaxID=669202 RepID=A0A0C2MHN4_THEKT|nr:hypothetical protein RF11_05876 [Thelohanellus kitauei]
MSRHHFLQNSTIIIRRSIFDDPSREKYNISNGAKTFRYRRNSKTNHYGCGDNAEKISSVSRTFNLPRSTVDDIVKKYRRTGVANKSAKVGALRVKLTPSISSRIVELMDDNVTQSVVDIKNRLNLSVDDTTVWRWVKKLGFIYKMTRPVPIRRNDSGITGFCNQNLEP